MHRGWMDNPALGGRREPLCRRAAWVWLIEEAAWQPCRVSIGGRTVTLTRGQISHSLRFLANAWRWSLAAVQRFIKRLKADTMIDTATDTGILVITICNYDRYQSSAQATDTPIDTSIESLPVQGRYAADTEKKEPKEVNTKKNPDTAYQATIARADDEPSDRADLFPGATVLRLPDPVEEAVRLWNEMAQMCVLPAVKALNAGRRSSLRLRLRECGGLDGWRAALLAVSQSSFLRGGGERRWKADFDFVLQPRHFLKLLEGGYADRGKPGGSLDWARREMGIPSHHGGDLDMTGSDPL